MTTRYSINPSVGVARVGNSPDEFYLEPDTIGGLPIECDGRGNPTRHDGRPVPVRRFKDERGRIKRQAARFQVFRWDDADPTAPPVPIDLAGPEVESFEWTVHIANKKAAWYAFAELEGNLQYGPENSYQARDVPLRNAGVTSEAERQKLIIDPGPRTVSHPGCRARFSRDTPPPDYPHFSFPPPPTTGYSIDVLGEIMTDDAGNLAVLGGFGRAGGDEPIDSFAGADTWHDDISDGPVACRVELADGTKLELSAWVLVGSPKFVPELVNIVTLDDDMFDVGVRSLGLVPDMYDPTRYPGGWNTDYNASYERDIEPIIMRPGGYRWVANAQSMTAFSPPPFNACDSGPANRANRERYLSYFRPTTADRLGNATLFAEGDSIPLMPLNSGTNSVSNVMVDKFFTLTETQFFLMGQWAEGKFTTGPAAPLPGVSELDRASTGNCVGWPMCPGIEVTWSLLDANLYEAPYRIRHRHDEDYYRQNGLSPSENETASALGCEPGDLTKRMAIPWQADFFQCTVQFVNYTDPLVNKANGIPLPPTYYSYWWPPQSPMFVLTGDLDAPAQERTGLPAGYQVYFPRGVNSFTQMIVAWPYLGFVVDQNSRSGDPYPYLVEVERNNERFVSASVAVGGVDNYVNATDGVFWPVYYLRSDDETTTDVHQTAALYSNGGAATAPYGTSPARGRIQAPNRGANRHGPRRPS